LNKLRQSPLYKQVQHWVKIMAACLALLWVPATGHCQIELLTEWEFLSCGSGHADDGCGSKAADPCEDDACASVEGGDYRSDAQKVTTARPDFGAMLLASWAHLASILAVEESASSLVFAAESPPVLLTSWQFVSRAALPPRAPSLAS
jgi:hypothetical protein